MISYDVRKIYEWPYPAKFIILTAMALFVFYLGFVADVSYMRNNIKLAQEKQVILKNNFKTSVIERVRLEKTILQFPKLKGTIQNWKKKIATAAEVQGIIDNMVKLGEQSHVKFNLFDPGTEIKDNLYHKIPIKIELTGSYDDIGNFLSSVANQPKLIVIGNFILSKESLGDKKDTTRTTLLNSTIPLIAQLELEIYRI